MLKNLVKFLKHLNGTFFMPKLGIDLRLARGILRTIYFSNTNLKRYQIINVSEDNRLNAAGNPWASKLKQQDFLQNNGSFCANLVTDLESSRVWFNEFTNCSFRTNSGFVFDTKNKKIYKPGYLDLYQDRIPEELHGSVKIKRSAKNSQIERVRFLKKVTVKCGIFLFNGINGNYCHFMTEVAPSLFSLVKSGKYKDFPIFLEKELAPNIISVVESIAENHELILVDNDTLVTAKLGVRVYGGGYVPFESLNGNSVRTVGKFNAEAISSMASFLLNKDKLFVMPNIKLFLKRRSWYRELDNQDALTKIAEKMGFYVVDTATLPLQRQIELISNANVIVGPAGASFANIIFSKPDAEIFMLSPANPHYDYQYWESIRGPSQGSIRFILGDQWTLEPHPAYKISPSLFLEVLGDVAKPNAVLQITEPAASIKIPQKFMSFIKDYGCFFKYDLSMEFFDDQSVEEIEPFFPIIINEIINQTIVIESIESPFIEKILDEICALINFTLRRTDKKIKVRAIFISNLEAPPENQVRRTRPLISKDMDE